MKAPIARTLLLVTLLALPALAAAQAQEQAPADPLSSTDARMPEEVTWWGPRGWRIEGTATGCTFTDNGGRDRVMTGYVQDFVGTIAGEDPLTLARLEKTGRWDLVVLREPSNGRCDGGAVTATGQSSDSDGFAVAMNLSWTPVITPDRNLQTIPLGPGTSVEASGSATACARLPDGTVALTGVAGAITGRDTTRAFTPLGDQTTFRGSWDLVLVHPATADRCTRESILVSGGSATQRATGLALNFTGEAAPPHVASPAITLPATHADLPTSLSIWGTGGAVRGTASKCFAPDPQGDLHMQGTAMALGFEGNVAGGADGGQTGRWDVLMMHAPHEVQCVGRTASMDGSTRSDLGILLGFNLSRSLTAFPEVTPLGPGTSFEVRGSAEACRRHGDSVAIAGFRGTITGRDTAVPARDVPPQSWTSTQSGAWDLVIARDVASLSCTTEGVVVTGPTSGFSPNGIVVGVRFAAADKAGPATLPTADARFPRSEAWWTPGWEITGTTTRCDVAHAPNRENVISFFLHGFEGTIRATNAGAPPGATATARWDLVIATVPHSGGCAPGRVSITGEESQWAGFVVALDFGGPVSTLAADALVLGPGKHLAGDGRAQACGRGSAADTLRLAGFDGSLTGRYLVPRHVEQGSDQTTTFRGAWDLVLTRPVTATRCDTGGVAFEASNGGSGLMLVALNTTGAVEQPPPSRPAVPPPPTERTPCYDLLSCPIGDVSSLRSRILGVRGQVLSAGGAAVAGAPVLLLGERAGALELLSISQTLDDGSFSMPRTTAPPAYAATVLGGHVVLADLAARGELPADGLLSLDLPVPEAAAAAGHSGLSAPELQLLADSFETAKPFGIPSASPEAPANIPIGYAGIRGIGVHPSAPVQDARAVVVQMAGKGNPRIPDPPGGPGAQYFALQVADIDGNEVPLQRIEFEFEAPPGSEGKDVTLHHFLLSEQRWESVEAQPTQAGTYAAAVDSLSLFAISTSQPSVLGAIVADALASPLTLPILGGVVVIGIATVALGRLRHVRRPTRAPAGVAIRAPPLPEREAIVSDLSVSAKGTKILHDVSFAFGQGEILALLGPSGSGKSTLLKALLGETDFTGEVSLFGIDPARRDAEQRRLVGYVSQDTELYPDMTLRENVEYFGKQYGFSASELKARVGPLLETLGLSERAQTRVGLLSGGQQRRASIAATLVHSPSLLILDEPTSGLDPVTRKSLWKFVRQASRELGVTVVVTTHFLDEADLADRVVILNKGRVVKAGTPQELVRSLPGGGKAVVVELQSASAAVEARVREAVRPLEGRGVVAAVDLAGYTARFFTPDAQAASRQLLDAFGAADVPVKQVTTEDCGMDAVFTYYAGERWREDEE